MTEPTSDPTTARARAIRDSVRRALDALNLAEVELSHALLLARDDYQHNDERLGHLSGAVALAASGTAMEYSKWDGFFFARLKREGLA
ncbi:membrane protein [Mycobacterium phage Nanosmite]|nr:membrane protein [Mycobacterium phage Nanosmite]